MNGEAVAQWERRKLIAATEGAGGAVSLKGRLGKAVMERIEAMPSVHAANERAERLWPARRAAMGAAYSPLDDEAAARKLASELASDLPVLKEVTIDLSRSRDDYVRDRAYRLLSAAVAGTPVQPIAPERRELFAEEEALGRLPMEQAFERLSEIQPRLLDAKRQAQARHMDVEPKDRAAGALSALRRSETKHWVAGGQDSGRELLETSVAKSIVHQYLDQLAGVSGMGTPSVAYFDHPRSVVL